MRALKKACCVMLIRKRNQKIRANIVTKLSERFLFLIVHKTIKIQESKFHVIPPAQPFISLIKPVIINKETFNRLLVSQSFYLTSPDKMKK